ncbi:acetyltransferase [Gordonia jinghuaiqii]|uniref:Acetyltransferase n=1 Tax=Gordonia jinghuaiqii TaxID=2758710 RepID=A0A7D7LRB2_9ACTN|nr:acetyltransferase [Gordonia jinghuaiqii]MCR5978184.1 acetyltransferase [Gordonia jinghuaiqii]QMT01360.1 acetyltransferase [Gordonia jinghuaiqii]
MISAIEYAIVNLGSTATLRASTPELDFVPPAAWYDLDNDTAHKSMASRVLLRSENPTPVFASNVVIQYFDLGQCDVIRLSEIDTTLDISALDEAHVLNHAADLDGYSCVDDGTYQADGTDLRIRRAQLSYATASGNSMLSIFTATTTETTWPTTEPEIKEMETRWLRKTTNPTSSAS